MTTALLIIDMQRALCSGAEAAFSIEGVIEKVNYAADTTRRSAFVEENAHLFAGTMLVAVFAYTRKHTWQNLDSALRWTAAPRT